MYTGGVNYNKVAGLAVQLKEVASPEFKEYCKQIVQNTHALAAYMGGKGEKFITGGSDNHLLMWDVRPHGLTGSKLEKVLEQMHITTNKNSLIGDKSAMNPGGIRIGMPAMTTRGFKEKEFEKIGEFLIKSVEVAKRIQDKSGKALKDFLPAVEADEELKKLSEEVKDYTRKYSLPGV